MSRVLHQMISLSVADGTRMDVYEAYPDDVQTRLPGVMLFQEAFGVNDHIRDVARRIAAEGYVVMAPELYHRTAPGFVCSYTDFSAAREHIQALSTEGIEADIRATAEALSAHPRVQSEKLLSIGFCLGGRVSFLAASVLPLRAAACFYGGGIAEQLLDRAAQIQAPLLLCWGGQDKHITADKIQAITSALDAHQKDYVNVVFSRADHGFFCDARASYHPVSAAQAWELVKVFFQQHLK
ncbi:MAG: dienelactone hydrolase family protein [Thermoflavifilum sp.]|uniref:dienelactone hydrolase family protein n=1 Tax=Thermoflavifilum sp. TaxID=1968839 RepID=UPI0018A52220|nr:dienelactone hydrolase family protein [Thermoflavifilum sp.]QOR76583.1 MAG: dienelactone hydrolase family protein [Thermoflavifilum sp.]